MQKNRGLASTQHVITVMLVACAYRIVSTMALLVIPRIIPWCLLASKRLMLSEETGITRVEARELIMKRWQSKWDRCREVD